MANLKFSQFQEQTDPANVQFVVGYNGTDNVRIDPGNLGGGATDLNGLTDVLIDGDSAYFINIPAGLTGNPIGNIVIGSGAANSMTTATENVVIGVNALASDSGNSNANENVIIGYGASQTSVTQVQGVVAIGFEASKANGNAFGGTHIGYKAADSTSSKYRSTSVGYRAMGGSAAAQDSVAIGNGASAFCTGTIDRSTTVGFEAGSRSDAQQTTLIGYQASKDNQAAGVVSLGHQAGYSQTTGTENTYLGWSAGYAVNVGSHNTVVGYEAGYASLSGDSNTLIGASAGYSGSTNLITGGNNILIGHNASPSAAGANNEITLGNATNDLLRMPGLGSTDGHVLTYSTASGGIVLAAAGGGGAGLVSGTGSDSMASVSTLTPSGNAAVASGTLSIALGGDSPFTGTNAQCEASGNDSVAIGTSAFANGTDAVAIGNMAKGRNYDVSVGRAAGRYASSGSQCVRIGMEAGFFGMTQSVGVGYRSSGGGGDYGSAVGTQTLQNTSGDYNTGVGFRAGETLTSGVNNTLIGSLSAPSANTVSNEITLGDSSVSALRCAVTTITSLSDERDKSEIKDLEYGLDFIDSLQPREFVWDNRVEIKKQPVFDENGEVEIDENGEVVNEDVEFYSANKGKKDFGFIAQEVKELDNDTLRLVYSENPEKLEMSYGKLVPILVKAIQELKAEIELLK